MARNIYISPYTGHLLSSRFESCAKFDCYDQGSIMVNYSDALAADPILTRLVEKDRVPWYNKPNLRALYALMIPVCMGVEWAVGFDAAMMVGIQTVHNWTVYFGYPSSARLGFVIASYALGGLITIPLVSTVGDRLGRKVSILIGSIITSVGAIIQAAAQNCECCYLYFP